MMNFERITHDEAFRSMAQSAASMTGDDRKHIGGVLTALANEASVKQIVELDDYRALTTGAKMDVCDVIAALEY